MLSPWTKDSGWSRSPWPYMTWGAMIGAIGAVVRVLNPNDDMFARPLMGVTPIVACALVGLLAWIVVAACQRIFAGRRGASR